MMRSRSALSYVLAGLIALFSSTQAFAAAPVDADPYTLLSQSTENVLARIKTNRAELKAKPSAIYSLVNEEVLPILDVPYVTALILGKHYRKATPDQRRAFANAFSSRMIRRYADALLEYSDEKVTYQQVKVGPKDKKVKVRSSITPSSGVPVPIIYSMRKSKKTGHWKIYDVSVDGISMITNYRTQFDSQISKQGLDKVIAGLNAE